MTFLSEIDSATGLIDAQAVKKKGLELRDRYATGLPFPHVAIDDFLPEAVLEQCLAMFPPDAAANENYDRGQERLKMSFSPEILPPYARQLFYSFNSRPFIQVLENICGISGLIPDPYFQGGGLHQIADGGHLSVHADFNHHAALNLERRINVLIYLNRDWSDEYGSQLELWDESMKRCVQSYTPLFNRCVIFNTTSNSNHGNPNPVRHPRRIPRRSIALYYYTATWDGSKREHTTQFRVRPGSRDAFDFRVRSRELVNDLLPPMLRRALVLLARRLRPR
jgi:hypothetical protein